MTDSVVVHDTFVIDRTFDAPPARVFAAFADPALKHRWFSGPPEWGPDEHALDFRVGGRELSRGGPAGGTVYMMEGLYHDIVPERRIVLAYDMYLDARRISVSLATYEFAPAGAGTRLVLTEQGAFFEGADSPAQREEGTRELLDQLGALLREPATLAEA